MTDFAPYYSAIRSLAIYGGGIATTFGVMTVGESSDVVSGVDHIIAGSKEIMIGVGMLTPVVMAAWGVVTHTKTAVLAAAAAIPGPDKLQAFHGIPDEAKLAVVNAMPDVVKISVKATATNGVAAAAADPNLSKVVSELPKV